jgi:hypothetical protein
VISKEPNGPELSNTFEILDDAAETPSENNILLVQMLKEAVNFEGTEWKPGTLSDERRKYEKADGEDDGPVEAKLRP